MRAGIVIRSVLFAIVLLAFSRGAFAQIGVSVGFGPPLLPIYEQPTLPGDGYLWAPGYWGYDYSANDYYWVPGTWVYPPQPGFLWTPGYWGWGGSGYYFNQGYWGPMVGYYGGINYGYGMWLYPGHTPVDFEANGTGGQRITVIPSLDMVEVMTGGGFDANDVQNLIAAAPKSSSELPANPAANARLASLEGDLAGLPSARLAPVMEASSDIPIPKRKPLRALRAGALMAQAGSPSPTSAASSSAVPLPLPKPAIKLSSADR